MTHAQPTNSFLPHNSSYAFAAYLSAESRHLIFYAIKVYFPYLLIKQHNTLCITIYYIKSVYKVYG